MEFPVNKPRFLNSSTIRQTSPEIHYQSESIFLHDQAPFLSLKIKYNKTLNEKLLRLSCNKNGINFHYRVLFRQEERGRYKLSFPSGPII